MSENRTERFVNLTASILGIANFAYSLSGAGSFDHIAVPAPPFRAFPTRLILFALLHGAASHAFATAIAHLVAFGPGFARILIIVVALIAAWTALFNVQWLFAVNLPAAAHPLSEWTYVLDYGKFLLLAIIAAAVSTYFVSVQSSRRSVDPDVGLGWSVAAYVIMAAVFIVESRAAR